MLSIFIQIWLKNNTDRFQSRSVVTSECSDEPGQAQSRNRVIFLALFAFNFDWTVLRRQAELGAQKKKWRRVRPETFVSGGFLLSGEDCFGLWLSNQTRLVDWSLKSVMSPYQNPIEAFWFSPSQTSSRNWAELDSFRALRLCLTHTPPGVGGSLRDLVI